MQNTHQVHLHDDEGPQRIVETLMDAVPSGSHLFITAFCAFSQEAVDAEVQYQGLLGTGRFPTTEEITRCFDGPELLEPGLVPLPLWRPDGVPDELTVGQRLMYGGIARKTLSASRPGVGKRRPGRVDTV